MEPAEGHAADDKTTTAGSALSAAQRRAEIRRRKLLVNSEDRMKRIVGYAKNEADNNGTLTASIWYSSCRAASAPTYQAMLT